MEDVSVSLVEILGLHDRNLDRNGDQHLLPDDVVLHEAVVSPHRNHERRELV